MLDKYLRQLTEGFQPDKRVIENARIFAARQLLDTYNRDWNKGPEIDFNQFLDRIKFKGNTNYTEEPNKEIDPIQELYFDCGNSEAWITVIIKDDKPVEAKISLE